MYNFNGSKRKRQLIALISLVVIAAMVVTTLVSALIYNFCLAFGMKIRYNNRVTCRCDGMVDVADSKSAGGDSVWVRVPPPAPRRSKLYIACSDLFYKSERAHAAAGPQRLF